MKTKERMAAFEEMVMELAYRLECQRKRIDELAARVAELEPMANEARRQAVRFAGRGNEIEDRQETTEAALFRAQERIAMLEAAHTVDAERIAELEQAQGAETWSNDTWTYDDVAGVAYEVVEER
jgi:DNA repair exonuclease SbcCD nuclease subunit